MSETNSSPSEIPPGVSQGIRPEELPPVEPPSAGFIVQLFLIPALIVAAVIGVWALFGKLADSEADWQQLVVELGSANEHRRWRSALNLAQILRNEQLASDEDAETLAAKPEVASAICKLLDETLASPSTKQEDIDHREFLARTLGSLRCDDIVLPILAKTLEEGREIEVRKSGMMSLALIAERGFEAQAKAAASGKPAITGSEESVVNLPEPLAEPTVDNEDVWQQLKLASQDEDVSIRQLAAYNLALVSGAEAIDTLKAMLMDGDSLTRANAAVGLARNGVSDAAESLLEVIEENLAAVDREAFQKLEDDQQQELMAARKFVRPTVLRNCARAAGAVFSTLPDDQSSKLISLLQQMAKDDDGSVRVEAVALLKQLGE